MPAASGAVGRATNDNKVSACHRQAPSKLKRRSPPSPEGRVRGQDGGCLSVPTSGTAACSISRTPGAAGEGVRSEASGPCTLWWGCRWPHLLWLLPPQPPGPALPGHPPPTPRTQRSWSQCSRRVSRGSCRVSGARKPARVARPVAAIKTTGLSS